MMSLARESFLSQSKRPLVERSENYRANNGVVLEMSGGTGLFVRCRYLTEECSQTSDAIAIFMSSEKNPTGEDTRGEASVTLYDHQTPRRPLDVLKPRAQANNFKYVEQQKEAVQRSTLIQSTGILYRKHKPSPSPDMVCPNRKTLDFIYIPDLLAVETAAN